MRDLTELETWILEIAAKASEEGKQNEKQGMKLSPGLIHRTTLVKILRPANTSDREGLSWGAEQDTELDTALTFLFQNRLVENLSLIGQGENGADARQAHEIRKLGRRISALENKFSVDADLDYNTHAPFGIAGLGWVKLREIAAKKQEGLAEA